MPSAGLHTHPDFQARTTKQAHQHYHHFRSVILHVMTMTSDNDINVKWESSPHSPVSCCCACGIQRNRRERAQPWISRPSLLLPLLLPTRRHLRQNFHLKGQALLRWCMQRHPGRSRAGGACLATVAVHCSFTTCDGRPDTSLCRAGPCISCSL